MEDLRTSMKTRLEEENPSYTPHNIRKNIPIPW